MQINILLTNPISKLIKDIAIPASIGLVFSTLYNIVDIFYAGLISTNALVALSYSSSLYFMFFGILFGVLSGLKSLIGKYLGQHNQKKALLYSHQGAIFAIICSFVVFAINYFYAYELLTFLKAPKDAIDITLQYYKILIFCFFAVSLNASLNASLTSKGDSKSYRNALIFGFFLNLTLNPIFMYGFWIIPAMGIKGIALSTTIIFSLHSFYLIYKCVKIKMLDLSQLKLFIPNIKIYKNIVKIGWAPGLNMFMMGISTIIIMYFISTYSSEAIAGFGIGYRIEQVMLLPILGINTAVLAIASNNFGALNFQRIKESYRLSLKYAYTLSAISVVALVIFSSNIAFLFTNDEVVAKYASTLLIIDVCSFFAYSTIFISIAILQGISTIKIIFALSIIRYIIAPSVLFYLIAIYFSLRVEYLFLCLLCINYITAIFLFLYTKKQIKILENSKKDIK